MDDNQLIAELANKLDAAIVMFGWSFIVIQKNDPNQQGIPSSGTAVFFEKLFDIPYGTSITKNYFDEGQGEFKELETQVYQSHFQISALVQQNVNDLSVPTALDVVNKLKMYLGSRNTLWDLGSRGIGILRISDVVNPPMTNDKDLIQQHPSFDMVFTYTKSIEFVVPYVTEVEGVEIPISNINGFDGNGQPI